MECQCRALSLVVLTLLQLCRAEIKNVQPQWYSANIINDGFQPKPISEIFSTDAPFSTANPIIVSSKNSYDDIQFLSTLAPPTSLSSFSTFETSTTYPSSSQSNQLSSFPPSPPSFQQNMPRTTQNQQSYQPPVELQQQISPAFEPMQPLFKIISEFQAQPQRNVQIQQEQSISTESLPQNLSVINLTAFYQPQQTDNMLPQDMPLEVVPQKDQISIGPEASTPRPPQTIPSQPILIYQQVPQSIQSYPNPSTSPRTIVGEQLFTTSAPPITRTLSSTFSSLSPTFSTIASLPVTTRTNPLLFSTTQPPSTQYMSSSTSPRVTVKSLSTIGSSSSLGSSTDSPTIINCNLPESTTPFPRLSDNMPMPLPINQLFPLKIRVVVPSGSITNVEFNPTAKPPMTTQKYIAYTVTRKPTTRRSPKPRKNTYDRCLQGCRKNGQPLCAAPLAQFPVDPKTLRGFPSVCHMACHNSYRKDAFEKVIDGSCGRLRTRIRTIDSNSKLKREELQKVQYFLDNSGQQAILEFTGAYS